MCSQLTVAQSDGMVSVHTYIIAVVGCNTPPCSSIILNIPKDRWGNVVLSCLHTCTPVNLCSLPWQTCSPLCLCMLIHAYGVINKCRISAVSMPQCLSALMVRSIGASKAIQALLCQQSYTSVLICVCVYVLPLLS